MNAYLLVLVAGLGSYACRVSMVALGHARTPAVLARAAPFVVPVTFAAVAAAGAAGGSAGAGEIGTRLAALAVAVIAARHTGRSYVAVATGLPVLWASSALVGA